MNIPWLCSFVVLAAASAFGQTSAAPATPIVPSDALRIMSVTGCVARGDKSDRITLTHAMVLPFGSAALAPEPISAAEPPPPSAAASAIPGAVGTAGTIVGTAPAGSSASSVDGYRLSGVDMTPWIGRRVQLIGTVIPAPPPAQAVAVESSERVALAAMPEFRVTSVQPVTGPCPK